MSWHNTAILESVPGAGRSNALLRGGQQRTLDIVLTAGPAGLVASDAPQRASLSLLLVSHRLSLADHSQAVTVSYHINFNEVDHADVVRRQDVR